MSERETGGERRRTLRPRWAGKLIRPFAHSVSQQTSPEPWLRARTGSRSLPPGAPGAHTPGWGRQPPRSRSQIYGRQALVPGRKGGGRAEWLLDGRGHLGQAGRAVGALGGCLPGRRSGTCKGPGREATCCQGRRRRPLGPWRGSERGKAPPDPPAARVTFCVSPAPSGTSPGPSGTRSAFPWHPSVGWAFPNLEEACPLPGTCCSPTFGPATCPPSSALPLPRETAPLRDSRRCR